MDFVFCFGWSLVADLVFTFEDVGFAGDFCELPFRAVVGGVGCCAFVVLPTGFSFPMLFFCGFTALPSPFEIVVTVAAAGASSSSDERAITFRLDALDGPMPLQCLRGDAVHYQRLS